MLADEEIGEPQLSMLQGIRIEEVDDVEAAAVDEVRQRCRIDAARYADVIQGRACPLGRIGIEEVEEHLAPRRRLLCQDAQPERQRRGAAPQAQAFHEEERPAPAW